MRRHVWLVLTLACAGCWSRDNPFDPGRCDPPCSSSESCFEGRCLPRSELGVSDRGATEAGGSRPVILGHQRVGTVASVNSTSWQEMDLEPLELSSSGGEYLFLLNAPDTWSEISANFGTSQFAIYADGELVSSAIVRGNPQQRIPVTVVGVRTLAAGTHTIRARWMGDQVRLGAANPTSLVAVQASGIASATGPSQELALGSQTWTDLDGLKPFPLQVTSSGGDYLLILSVQETWTTAKGSLGYFRIVVDGSETSGSGNYQVNFSTTRQYVPIAVVTKLSLPAGQHTVKAQYWSSGGGQSVHVGPGHPSWLVALPVPSGILLGSGPSAGASTSSTSWTDLEIQPAPSLVTSGGTHLFLLSATDTWIHASSGGWAQFQLLVDGATLGGGLASSTFDQQHLPVTFLGVQALSAGAHPLKVQWKTSGGTAYTSSVPPRLLAF